MAVAWKVQQVSPSKLQETLDAYSNERFRVFEVSPTPGPENVGQFTVVGYRMSYEGGTKKQWNGKKNQNRFQNNPRHEEQDEAATEG